MIFIVCLLSITCRMLCCYKKHIMLLLICVLMIIQVIQFNMYEEIKGKLNIIPLVYDE
jgi:hypothetical protein